MYNGCIVCNSRKLRFQQYKRPAGHWEYQQLLQAVTEVEVKVSPQLTKSKNTNITAHDCAVLMHSFKWIEDNIKTAIAQVTQEFWNEEFDFYLMALEKSPGLFWSNHRYFVSEVSIGQKAHCYIRISDIACDTLMSCCLGEKNLRGNAFNALSELEGRILSRFNNLVFENIKKYFIPARDIKNIEQEEHSFEEILNIGLFIYKKNQPEYEEGKIILSIPIKLLDIQSYEKNREETIDTTQFEKAKTEIDIFVGKSKISLEDLKNLEEEDIIILDKSNLNKMKLSGNLNLEFKVNPDPKLVLSVDSDEEGDNEGGDNTVSEIETNMWDNIQIEVGAEFKKIKLSLGELREMSEGLVVDLASVYDNQITLQVEEKPVAKGELVIIGDRYGVKITEIVQQQEEIKQDSSKAAKSNEETAEETEDEDINLDDDMDDDDFDYGDFEIDDDDI